VRNLKTNVALHTLFAEGSAFRRRKRVYNS